MTQKEKPSRKSVSSKKRLSSSEAPLQAPLAGPVHSSLELDESVCLAGYDINLGGKRLGGPTGGDFSGGGKGPALGAKHAADDSTADHYGSREETTAALEDKIALQNTLKLREY